MFSTLVYQGLSASIFIFLAFAFYSYKQAKNSDNSIITYKDSVSCTFGVSTLTASALGVWILFSPASSALWGGMASVFGYALASALPLLALAFLGLRIRKYLPNGSSLIEYTEIKLGKSYKNLLLVSSIFYMFIFLCAEMTAVAKVLQSYGDLSLGLGAVIILIATASYSLLGGLRLSIKTDLLQFVLIIIVLIAIMFMIPWERSFDTFNFIETTASDFTRFSSLSFGLTLIIAVLCTEVFNHASWQRIYALKENAVKKSFIISSLIVFVVIFILGLAGLFAKSTGLLGEDANLALFDLLQLQNPIVIFILIAFVVSLVLSSSDSLLNGIASLFVLKKEENDKSLKIYRAVIVLTCFPVYYIASKGYDVFYLFLLADLLCCALIGPAIFSILGKKEYKNTFALSIVSLVIGGVIFPGLDFSNGILVTFIGSESLPALLVANQLFFSFVITVFLSFVLTMIFSKEKN